jgi:hypothetical protein
MLPLLLFCGRNFAPACLIRLMFALGTSRVISLSRGNSVAFGLKRTLGRLYEY